MPNQFEVAIVSAKRTKELNRGATPMVSIDENTPTNRSIALKEIAEGKVGIDYLTK
jgi:DNA-directed RNA polymerase omega subunit